MNRWTEEIDKITGRFLNSFSLLSEEELNWKPSPEIWSIAQNIDHLIRVNESYFPVFSNLKHGSYNLPFIARFGFVVKFFGNFILKSVQPDNNKKTQTFPIWKPAESNFEKNILHRFEEHQVKLKENINMVADKIRENAVISSPANKNIVYKLETAFDIIVAHERRHLNQANKIYELLRPKKTA